MFAFAVTYAQGSGVCYHSPALSGYTAYSLYSWRFACPFQGVI
ncbi:hypothetical protein FVEN_g13182 [Fusarium venenatum]|nr:hypothetical protein FVEN_g13182 [Fusarium venenatum]